MYTIAQRLQKQRGKQQLHQGERLLEDGEHALQSNYDTVTGVKSTQLTLTLPPQLHTTGGDLETAEELSSMAQDYSMATSE